MSRVEPVCVPLLAALQSALSGLTAAPPVAPMVSMMAKKPELAA